MGEKPQEKPNRKTSPKHTENKKKKQHSPSTLRNIQSTGLAQPSHYLEAQMKGKHRCPDSRLGSGARNGSGGGGGGGGVGGGGQ